MGAHNDTANLYSVYGDGSQTIADPGSGGTFNLHGKWGGIATIESGSRVVPDAPKGTMFMVRASGSVSLTNSGQSIAVLEDGDLAFCIADTNSTWKAIVLGSASQNFASQLDTTINDLTETTPLDDLSAATTLSGVLNELYANLPVGKFTTSSTTTSVTPAAGALTGAKHVFWQNTGDGALSLTPRTATQLYGDTPAAYVGLSYLLTIVNRGDNTITLQAASGITYTGETTIATLVTRTYLVTFTSDTAASVVSVSKGTIET